MMDVQGVDENRWLLTREAAVDRAAAVDRTDGVEQADSVDRVNAGFYGRFPYPWRPRSLDCPLDPDFARVMLNQSIGSWQHARVPRNPAIWVAGCGTNQAVVMALQFPGSPVVGSDLSGPSLAACEATARELGIRTLELRQESVNHASYREQFDYILCTGVVHHNAEPAATLQRLAQALKPSGVLELMVYNRYHRIQTSAFQRAVRLLAGTASRLPDFEQEFALTRALVETLSGGDGIMGQTLATLKDASDERLADALMQPIEHSYTVDALDRLARSAGLELMTSCISPYDRSAGTFAWHMRFPTPALQAVYDALPDVQRWAVTNFILLERSPMLWFYLQRQDSPSPRLTEREMCEAALGVRFRVTRTERRAYVLDSEGAFRAARPLPYPAAPPPDLRQLVEAIDERVPFGELLDRLAVATDFATLNLLRLRLTTSAFPFLTASSY